MNTWNLWCGTPFKMLLQKQVLELTICMIRVRAVSCVQGLSFKPPDESADSILNSSGRGDTFDGFVCLCYSWILYSVQQLFSHTLCRAVILFICSLLGFLIGNLVRKKAAVLRFAQRHV